MPILPEKKQDEIRQKLPYKLYSKCCDEVCIEWPIEFRNQKGEYRKVASVAYCTRGGIGPDGRNKECRMMQRVRILDHRMVASKGVAARWFADGIMFVEQVGGVVTPISEPIGQWRWKKIPIPHPDPKPISDEMEKRDAMDDVEDVPF